MKHIDNDSTLRFLRKKHKNWSEEQIKTEAERIWQNYVEAKKEKLKKEAEDQEKYFNGSLDKEQSQLWMDYLDDETNR